ncbi:hypothetical protein N7448_002175 [Penicillium atrosanguineum]|uniref:F-box domain-containing protein n=1 Tax=Penicillium atrosanguineum TaxID=1132637 RepID=A0A9W9HDG7_9EURO|nr:hypothetical protein N7526_006622 [Penicillium atrosanguineum]KAJ5144783.1 hypothetical protein N7448_002175 [Penicillium atrosanguineum]KAJ5311218.1 hypothetical protein N7476_007078 [Penicillium atrosanguineum]
MSDLWCSLISAIAPNTEAMPAVLQSTIHLLESELVKARAALQEIQPDATLPRIGDEIAVGAMAAYRQNLIGRAPDFYGARRLTLKELGLQPVVHEITSEVMPEMMAQSEAIHLRAPLEEMLTNSLILDHMAPYLSVPSLMALSMASRHLHDAITKTPYIFRHLDLTRCKGAQLPASRQDDDSQTEDEVYSAPLRHIFSSLGKRSLLQDVRTLVLDGLSVPADLVSDIILTDRFNVNILSIRECTHLNEHKLMQIIQHAVRPTRPEGTPRVKGIYFFSPVRKAPCAVVRRRYRDWWGARVGSSRSPSQSSSSSSSDNEDEVAVTRPTRQQQNEWYSPTGKIFKHALEEGWARTLQKAEGIIAFDAVLCRGPRHDVNQYTSVNEESAPSEGPLLEPAVATVALGPRGCDGCHSSPEGPAIWGQSPDMHFPLLSPMPLHVSNVATAKRPEMIPGKHPLLFASCADCLADRWCQRCNKWFCSNCLSNPQHVRANLSPHQTAVRPEDHNGPRLPDRERLERGVSKDCWECGPTVSRLLNYESRPLNLRSSVFLVSGTASTPVRAAGAIIASTTMRVALPQCVIGATPVLATGYEVSINSM